MMIGGRGTRLKVEHGGQAGDTMRIETTLIKTNIQVFLEYRLL
jgi:hypothetical protein